MSGKIAWILAIAALLGRAAGGIALDDEQLRQRRVLFLAVGELAGQARDVERAFAAGHLARLARGFARARGVDDFVGDRACFARVLCRNSLELLVDDRFDHGLDFGGDQLVLGLEENFGSGTFTDSTAIRPSRMSSPVSAILAFFGKPDVFDVVIQRARQRRAKTGQMRAAVLVAGCCW